MQKKKISSRESIEENLQTWCYEVGSRFEEIGRDAADDFFYYFKKLNNLEFIEEKNNIVYDIGSGDGSSTNRLTELGFDVVAVDINYNKLKKTNARQKICEDVLTFLKNMPAGVQINNIFSHHSLEHMVDAEEIINFLGEKLMVGGLYYSIVPANDYLHSVHHVVFESPRELLPSVSFDVIELCEQIRFGEKEYKCILKKAK